MKNIIYRAADYLAPDDKKQILRLYQEVFHIDFALGYDKWFCTGERRPLGEVALEKDSGKIIGHWGCVRFDALISGRRIPFRLSMGTMTARNYQGKGIATSLYHSLYNAILKARDARFFMGYPNDTSYRLLAGQLGFVPLRDYHFVVFPRGEPVGEYFPAEDAFCEEHLGVFEVGNCLARSRKYMSWRYGEEKYEKWQSKTGCVFISTRFMDKTDLLYWSREARREELLDFAAFLYERQGVGRVTTWNTASFLDTLPREDRNYHMCINYLDCGPAEKAEIQKDWFFYMGDCELF